MKKFARSLNCLLATGLVLMPSTQLMAQDAATSDGTESTTITLEELIVTAQRREQGLQQVPLSVTAISAAELERKQITDVLDLQYAVPNISLATNTGTASGARIFLRGVGEDESRVSADPAVGVYVDGVYVGRQAGALFDLVDVERVEVLRGPQGTLYGRNSNGGAIKLVSTRASTEETSYRLGGTVGSDGRLDIKATGNWVLGENTALRATLLDKTRDGFHTLNPNGDFAALAGTEVGELDTTAFRVALAHQFNDSWSADLVVDSTRDDSDPIPDSAAPPNDTDNQLFTIEPLADVTCSALAPAAFLPIGCFTDYRSRVDTDGVSLTINGVFNNYEFSSITGYRQLEDDLSTRIGFPYQQQTDQDQISQEFTLTSQFDSAFNYVAGLFFFQEDVQLDTTFIFPFELGVKTDAVAAFFQSTYAFTDSLTLTTGVRYTDESKELDAFAVFLQQGRQETLDFENTSYNISLNNQFNDNLMGYVSFSTGFKSGGWSPDCFSPAACFAPVDEEELDSVEVGVRSDWLGGRLRLNATYFSNSYEGLQIGATVPGLGFTRFNTQEAEISGLELETIFQVNDNLLVNFTYGTLDAEYTQLTLAQAGGLTNDGASPGCNGVVSIQCALGLQLKNAPDYKGTLGVEYRLPLRSGTLTAGIDFSFEDESFSLVANGPPHALTDPGTLVDARISWESEQQWRIALWAKNLGDEEFARAATAGSFTQYASDPQTVGVDFGIDF